jgi:hypothetical protein
MDYNPSNFLIISQKTPIFNLKLYKKQEKKIIFIKS